MLNFKIFMPILLIILLALFSLLPEQLLTQGYASIGKHLFQIEFWQRSHTQSLSNIGHVLGYGTLSLAMSLAWSFRWWQVGCLAMLIGLMFEIAQIWVPTRHASLGDLGFDAAGTIIALAAVWLVKRSLCRT